MTQEFCECEGLVVAAMRSGIWPSDLQHHIATCAHCAETKRLAQRFHHAAKVAAQTPPPAANTVWQKMQVQRQQQALRRATQCMALLRILAALYVVVFGAWYLPRLWHMQPAQLATSLGSLSSGGVFAGVSTAMLAVFLGSCCLAFLGSRTSFRLRS